MATNFSKLFVYEDSYYNSASPIIIEAGGLFKNTKTGDLHVQLKLNSVSDKRIKAVEVVLKQFDVAHTLLDETVTFEYLDLNQDRGNSFGQKIPIQITNKSVREFSAIVTRVVFEDSSAITIEPTAWKGIPRQEKIEEKLGKELAEQYRRVVPSPNFFEPIVFDDFWKCTCGETNRIGESSCYKCKKEKGHQFLALDHEHLNSIRKDAILEKASVPIKGESLYISEYEEAIELLKSIPGWKNADKLIGVCKNRIEDIKAKKEAERLEQERKEEQWRKEAEKKKKRNKKITVIAISAICVIAVFVVLLFTVFIPNSEYNDAKALMDEGKYKEAIAAFEAMDGYRDSATMIDECNYCIAVSLMEKEEYDEAVSAFRALKGYKDSAAKTDECNALIIDGKYNDAIALMNDGEYSKAVSSFRALKGYKDSAAKIDECNTLILDGKYNDAIALMDEGKYDAAISAFEALDGHRDSVAKIDECNALIFESSYKKIKTAKVGDYVYFGEYEQDNNTFNGMEKIEWLVLDVKDGKALLISKYGLDNTPYHTSETDVTWETCSLRKWLNEDFVNTAFSAIEKAVIPTVTVSADKNPEWGTNPGNATQDQVFLLSISEVKKYFSYNSEMSPDLTDYAIAKGALTQSDSDKGCWWWLRTPGMYRSYAAVVTDGDMAPLAQDGYILDIGGPVDVYTIGTRPAMWVCLSAE